MPNWLDTLSKLDCARRHLVEYELSTLKGIGILGGVSPSPIHFGKRVLGTAPDARAERPLLQLAWPLMLCCTLSLSGGCVQVSDAESASEDKTEGKDDQTTSSKDIGSGASTHEAASNQPTESEVSTASTTKESESTASSAETKPDTSNQTTGNTSTGTTSEVEPKNCEDGQLRECFERPDGTPIAFPNNTPVGPYCKSGAKQCVDNEWSSCVGAVEPKAKDGCDPGNDDNCNGIPNEGCTCTAGQTQVCGTSLGECREGKMTCQPDGTWSACEGQVEPRTEICDGRADEDCDGRDDRDDPSCECINGTQKKCGLLGQRGDCALGARSCSNGRWSRCRPRFRVTQEACGQPRSDALGQATGDENCDGRIDESQNAPAPSGCSHYMLDADGDGWGAVGNSIHSPLGDYTYGCFCRSPGNNWRRYDPRSVSDKRKVAKDCGDCPDKRDEGWLVNPTKTEYFAEPSSCLQKVRWRGGAFDYNCSGREEPEHNSFAPSCPDWANNNESCETTAYWMGSEVPPCGSRGSALKCKEGGSGIVPECMQDPIGAMRVSSCR